MMTKRILVTGAAGFIGAALCVRLASEGHRVFGIDNLNSYYDPQLKRDRLSEIEAIAGEAFTFSQCDFADRASFANCLADLDISRIAHLGAQPGVRYSLENPHAYIEANIVGHLNMLEFARERQVEHLVYASSSSVYGGNEKVPFSVDDRVDHPFSLYAATKKADELMSETYAHLYRIPQTGLRFFTVYGPWGRPDMMPWIFTAKILRGEPIPVFNHGKMQRDFTFIDDIVSGIVACLGSPPADDGTLKPGGSTKPHAIYNIGNNRPEQLLDVIAIIERACGRKAEIEMLPMQKGDVPRTYADIEAMERDHGYSPTTPVDVGFPRFVEWFKSYHGI